MEHHPEVHGDALLNGEPSSPFSVRFGEKGPLWLEFTVRTAGAHGAYTHATASAHQDRHGARHAPREADGESGRSCPTTSRAASTPAARPWTARWARAPAHIVDKVTLNIGTIKGGVKVNMVPSSATFEADIRLPLGVTRERVLAEVEKILKDFPDATMKETNCNLPSWVDPDCDIIEIVQSTVRGAARLPTDADRQPRRHRCAPLALSQHSEHASMARSRTAWAPMTSTSTSRSSCTSCARTCWRGSII